MKYIPEHELRNGFQIEILCTLISEDFVRVFVMHNNKDLTVAVFDDLFGLSEQTAFLHVENVVFFLGFLSLDILL